MTGQPVNWRGREPRAPDECRERVLECVKTGLLNVVVVNVCPPITRGGGRVERSVEDRRIGRAFERRARGNRSLMSSSSSDGGDGEGVFRKKGGRRFKERRAKKKRRRRPEPRSRHQRGGWKEVGRKKVGMTRQTSFSWPAQLPGLAKEGQRRRPKSDQYTDGITG